MSRIVVKDFCVNLIPKLIRPVSLGFLKRSFLVTSFKTGFKFLQYDYRAVSDRDRFKINVTVVHKKRSSSNGTPIQSF